jgi:hypothetical protein
MSWNNGWDSFIHLYVVKGKECVPYGGHHTCAMQGSLAHWNYAYIVHWTFLQRQSMHQSLFFLIPGSEVKTEHDATHDCSFLSGPAFFWLCPFLSVFPFPVFPVYAVQI